MSEWVVLSVWVIALVASCAGLIALLKVRGVHQPLTLFLTIAVGFLVAMLVIVGPLLLIFMPSIKG